MLPRLIGRKGGIGYQGHSPETKEDKVRRQNSVEGTKEARKKKGGYDQKSPKNAILGKKGLQPGQQVKKKARWWVPRRGCRGAGVKGTDHVGHDKKTAGERGLDGRQQCSERESQKVIDRGGEGKLFETGSRRGRKKPNRSSTYIYGGRYTVRLRKELPTRGSRPRKPASVKDPGGE